MAPANVHQFSIGDERYSFELHIPPSTHGHTLRIAMDPAKNKGTVAITRRDRDISPSTPNVEIDPMSPDQQSLEEVMHKFRPFDCSPRVPAFLSSRSSLAPGTWGSRTSNHCEEYCEEYAADGHGDHPPSPTQRLHGITVYPPSASA